MCECPEFAFKFPEFIRPLSPNNPQTRWTPWSEPLLPRSLLPRITPSRTSSLSGSKRIPRSANAPQILSNVSIRVPPEPRSKRNRAVLDTPRFSRASRWPSPKRDLAASTDRDEGLTAARSDCRRSSSSDPASSSATASCVLARITASTSALQLPPKHMLLSRRAATILSKVLARVLAPPLSRRCNALKDNPAATAISPLAIPSNARAAASMPAEGRSKLLSVVRFFLSGTPLEITYWPPKIECSPDVRQTRWIGGCGNAVRFRQVSGKAAPTIVGATASPRPRLESFPRSCRSPPSGSPSWRRSRPWPTNSTT
jgi:hypothetical protein